MEEEFSFKFPRLDAIVPADEEGENTIKKIHEYLDDDVNRLDNLLCLLEEAETRLDARLEEKEKITTGI